MRKFSILKRGTVLAATLVLVLPMNLLTANAASLSTGSLLLSDSRPSTAATYTATFSNVSLAPIKCIQLQFSDTASGTTKPTGMTLTGATLSGTSNYVPTPGSWSVVNDNAAGWTQLIYATGETPASASSRTVVINGYSNGSVAATSYFLQFKTYNNVDCTTSPVDSSTVAFIYTSGQALTATVDPTLSFTIAGVASGQTVNGATTTITTTTTTIPMGTLSTGANTIGAQDLIVGTNANGGYTVTTKYTGTLSSGSYAITDDTDTNATPAVFSASGTESFGYTTNDATLGTGTAGRFISNKWGAFTTNPLEVAYDGAPASTTTRVGYQIGISPTTPAGAYSTTIIFVATPTY
jgi:hypothetical protein